MLTWSFPALLHVGDRLLKSPEDDLLWLRVFWSSEILWTCADSMSIPDFPWDWGLGRLENFPGGIIHLIQSFRFLILSPWNQRLKSMPTKEAIKFDVYLNATNIIKHSAHGHYEHSERKWKYIIDLKGSMMILPCKWTDNDLIWEEKGILKSQKIIYIHILSKAHFFSEQEHQLYGISLFH